MTNTKKADETIMRKAESLHEEAIQAGMTLEAYLSWKAAINRKPPSSPRHSAEEGGAAERKRQAEERKKHMAAISWAAQKQNSTYGKLVGTLDASEKEQIYAEYVEYQAAREREIDARVEATREVVKRLDRTHSVVPPGSRFDPRLTNSVVNTEDVPGEALLTKCIV